MYYTLGQRRGLGIASDRPVFVREIRVGTNTLVVAPREEVTVSELELVESGYLR